MAALIVDTAPLVAAAAEDESAHELAVVLLRKLAGPFLVTTPVLTEAEYLIRKKVGYGSARALIADVIAGTLQHVALEAPDLARAQAVMEAHPGIPLGLADASIVAVAERLRIKTILTFDHSDFRRVRPAHVKGFELIPSEADLASLEG